MAKERTIVLKPGKAIRYRIDAKGKLTIKVKEGHEKELVDYFKSIVTVTELFIVNNGD